MNILINCPIKFSIENLDKTNIGGIESLNIDLAKKFSKKNYNVTIATHLKKKVIKNGIKNFPINQIVKNPDKYHFDRIISSNDSTIFNYFPNAKKFLWLHNPLQIEKAIRKKQLFSIIRNKPTAVFVSDYLNKITSSLYFFKKRVTINNFLLNDFIFNNTSFKKRKSTFVWSVARNKGLNETINMWINYIHPKTNEAKFIILGVNKFKSKFSNNYLESKNIYLKGRVNRRVLKKIYTESTAMICLGYDETFCLNALEANACGLPVISFGKSALSSFINNNYNGFIVKDFKSLAKKIENYLKMNKKYKLKIIKNCINHSKKYNVEKSFTYWIKLLK